MRSDTQRVDAQAMTQVLREAGVEQVARPVAVSGAEVGPPSKRLTGSALRPLAQQVAEVEREAVAAAMAATGGNKHAAAQMLGIARATLYQRLSRVTES